MTSWPSRRSSVRTILRAMTTAIAGIALCSCAAITDPYVSPTSKDISNPTDFNEATKYAASKAEEMHTKLKELNAYDFGTSAFIMASGIVGLAMGAYGAHADALMAAGLGAGAAYGARNYLPIQDRKDDL